MAQKVIAYTYIIYHWNDTKFTQLNEFHEACEQKEKEGSKKKPLNFEIFLVVNVSKEKHEKVLINFYI